MAHPDPRRVRWVEEAEDPELEERLQEELERKRLERIADRERRVAEKRSRRLFTLFVLVALALVVVIGYGVLVVMRTQLG